MKPSEKKLHKLDLRAWDIVLESIHKGREVSYSVAYAKAVAEYNLGKKSKGSKVKFF
jgi:hypothetical protein